ncbi:Major facilitator superfamily domain [Trinorchestia longiramus]|nr:Major facilitator superfamily domain [Trinorchestia longiramus]
MFLYLVGKFGASATFLVVYVFATELFPTCYRGVGLGSCSMIARVGGTLAPLLVTLFEKQRMVAPMAFGVLGCTSGVLVVLLPETLGSRLPQTISESEQFGSEQRLLDCCYCITAKREKNQNAAT